MGLLEVTVIIVAIVILVAMIIGVAIWIVRSKNANTRELQKCQQQVDADPTICVKLASSLNAYPGPLFSPDSVNACTNQKVGTWGAPTDIYNQPGVNDDKCRWTACNSTPDQSEKIKQELGARGLCKILSVSANTPTPLLPYFCDVNEEDYIKYCPNILEEGDPCTPPKTLPPSMSGIQPCKQGLFCNSVSRVCTTESTQTCVDLAVNHEIYPGFTGATNAPNKDNALSPQDLETWTTFCQTPTQVQNTLQALTTQQKCKILASSARFGYDNVDPSFYVNHCAGQGAQGDYCINPNSASDITYCGPGLTCDKSVDGGRCEQFNCKDEAVNYYAYPSLYTTPNTPQAGIYVPAGTASNIVNSLNTCALTVASSTAAFTGANQMTNDEICYSLRAFFNSVGGGAPGSLNDSFYGTNCKKSAPQDKPCILVDAGKYPLCDAGLTCKPDTTATYNNAYTCQP